MNLLYAARRQFSSLNLVYRTCALGFLLLACTSTHQFNPALTYPYTLTPSLIPTSTLAPTPTPADTGWLSKLPGLDRREITIPFPALGFAERVVLFRVDPQSFAFRVLYAPGAPRFVAQWDRSAQLVFNAGYFDEKNAALGLLVSDGKTFGRSYEGIGGMFAVAGGAPVVRSLAAQPYRRGEPLAQAVQGFPMLIYPDGSTFAKEDSARARRTALGQDAGGTMYLVVAPHPAFTLAELARWLRDSKLGLTIAFNLDGGGSTGYYAGPNDAIDSLTPIPAVVAVYSR